MTNNPCGAFGISTVESASEHFGRTADASAFFDPPCCVDCAVEGGERTEKRAITSTTKTKTKLIFITFSRLHSDSTVPDLRRNDQVRFRQSAESVPVTLRPRILLFAS